MLVLILAAVAFAAPSWHNTAQVITHTGVFTGVIEEDVRQFRNIPFALPPINDLRWKPPVAVPTSSEMHDSTEYPPSCPQYAPYNSSSSPYIVIEPQLVVANTKAEQYSKTSEDCLSLAVWTPVEADGLPVIMFMTGGGWNTGGIDIPYQIPQNWVQRTKSHIVVTINYRVNIFGFPHAAGLEDQNLGILDQRMALEWVRDNIEAFGGDPSRITLWGQSAGAGSTDVHAFAYHSDPVASSYFMDSGSVFLLSTTPDTTYTNFTFVAQQLGCDTSSSDAELACMRGIDFQTITDFVGGYGENKTEPGLSFLPTPDEKIVFANYTDRYAQRLLSESPAIFTSNKNEGTMFVPMIVELPSAANPYGVWTLNTTQADQATLSSFQCPATRSAMLRQAAGRKTYRWQYAGNFTNVSPLPWQGAYHSSDLPMLFGSHPDFRGESTAEEYATSESMQNHLLAFMRDPANGPAQLGWKDTSSGLVPVFGSGMSLVAEKELDSACEVIEM